MNDTFSGTTISPSYDNNGNLSDDGVYKYTYDAWNRLVKVTGQDKDVTIQQASYDALGRRIKKVVTNSGDLDGTTVYYYNRNQVIETRDGSANLLTQVYHGTRYIDEVVAMRTEYGRVYVHQDANYNVIALTDLTGRVLERYYYSPYGQVEAVQYADTPDLDLDGDIDQDDEDMIGSGSDCWGTPSGVCLLADFNCDNTVDAADLTLMQKKRASLSGDMEMRRVPAAPRSQLGNPFAHQGLQLDPEIGSYQNRARQYAPKLKRFIQRDPLGILERPLAGSNEDVRLSVRTLDEDPSTSAFARSPGVFPWGQYADGMSSFVYALGNPVAYTDPDGLCCMCCLTLGHEGNGICFTTVGDGEFRCHSRYGWDYSVPIGGGFTTCNNPILTYFGAGKWCSKTCFPILLPALGLPFTNPFDGASCSYWGWYTLKTCCKLCSDSTDRTD